MPLFGTRKKAKDLTRSNTGMTAYGVQGTLRMGKRACRLSHDMAEVFDASRFLLGSCCFFHLLTAKFDTCQRIPLPLPAAARPPAQDDRDICAR
jgi:hypothetical protein